MRALIIRLQRGKRRSHTILFTHKKKKVEEKTGRFHKEGGKKEKEGKGQACVD